MTDQNRFSPNFNIYDYVNAAELNSALGHMVVERLTQITNGLEPYNSVRDLSSTIPAVVWDAVQHANRLLLTSLAPVSQKPPEHDLACTWPDCGQAFSSQAKLRRHHDMHTPDDVADAIEGMYKAGSSTGRGWLEKIRHLYGQIAADAEAEAAAGTQADAEANADAEEHSEKSVFDHDASENTQVEDSPDYRK
ncbi:hypothetical protein EDC01DRAFT_759977 [Geopyxis carbonaria]|nr:hypothetical protein EDC01DRAFT_759977 [Geopyxis carbonaria]